ALAAAARPAGRQRGALAAVLLLLGERHAILLTDLRRAARRPDFTAHDVTREIDRGAGVRQIVIPQRIGGIQVEPYIGSGGRRGRIVSEASEEPHFVFLDGAT